VPPFRQSHRLVADMAPKAKSEAKAEKKKKAEKKEDPEESKIPAVEQPDKKDFDEKLAQLQTKIDTAQVELKKVKESLQGSSSGNDEYKARRADLHERIRAETEQIDFFMAKKNEVRAAMGLKSAEEKQQANELRDMKKKLGYTDIAQIDQRIKELNDELTFESISLKKEKELMKELATLRKNIPEVRMVNKMEGEVAVARELNKANTTLKEQLEQINDQVNFHRDAKKALNDEFSQMMSERDSKVGNNQELYAARDKLNEDVRNLIQERNELRDNFRQQERNYYEYQKEQRNLRWEKQREEREVRDKEWEQEKRKREAEKLDDQPFVQETTLIEQTIKFCKTFQPKEVEKKEEAKAASVDCKDGEMVLVDKKNREEEFYYAPTKKGKASKAKGKKEGGSSKPIKHNAETFKLFASLELDAPITTEDIPATLEKLEALMQSYQEKIKDWEAKRDEMKAQILEKGFIEKPAEEKVEEAAEKEEE